VVSARRLERHGIRIDLVPDEYRAEGVVAALAAYGPIDHARVLLPRSDIGRETIGDELRKQGAAVTEVVTYRTAVTELEREGEPDIYRLLLDSKIDVVTFTSASAVRSFVRVVGAEPAADLLRGTLVASIGPVTAEAASQYGIQTTIMPAEYTVPALAASIVDHFRKRT
jgi:uroporphyrinogen III methyltransferase / synthase